MIYGTPHLARLENKVILGERVMLCSIPYLYRLGQSFQCVLSSGKHGVIRIGDDAGLNGTAIFAEKEVSIGARVMIGAGSRITDIECHPVDVLPRRYAANTPPKPIAIEDDVWLGVNVTVLPGVRIGRGSVIGAGSIVTGDIPPMVVAAGAPARVIRPLSAEEVHSPS